MADRPADRTPSEGTAGKQDALKDYDTNGKETTIQAQGNITKSVVPVTSTSGSAFQITRHPVFVLVDACSVHLYELVLGSFCCF